MLEYLEQLPPALRSPDRITDQWEEPGMGLLEPIGGIDAFSGPVATQQS